MVLAQPLAVYRLGRVAELRLHDGLGDLQECGKAGERPSRVFRSESDLEHQFSHQTDGVNIAPRDVQGQVGYVLPAG